MPGDLPTPVEPLFRIGRATPGPFAWVPWQQVGAGRFDDLREQPTYRVLYAGDRLACLYESLAKFRPDLAGTASEGITREWLLGRRMGKLRLRDPDRSLRWLDLASPQTYADFRVRFGELLGRRGFRDFDTSAATSEDRPLSQQLALWSYQNGYGGIRYPTRHHPHLSCWAIFEGTPFEVLEDGTPIALDDPDLRVVAEAWGLRLPNA